MKSPRVLLSLVLLIAIVALVHAAPAKSKDDKKDAAIASYWKHFGKEMGKYWKKTGPDATTTSAPPDEHLSFMDLISSSTKVASDASGKDAMAAEMKAYWKNYGREMHHYWKKQGKKYEKVFGAAKIADDQVDVTPDAILAQSDMKVEYAAHNAAKKDYATYWMTKGIELGQHYKAMGKEFAQMYSTKIDESPEILEGFFTSIGADIADYWTKKSAQFDKMQKLQDREDVSEDDVAEFYAATGKEIGDYWANKGADFASMFSEKLDDAKTQDFAAYWAAMGQQYKDQYKKMGKEYAKKYKKVGDKYASLGEEYASLYGAAGVKAAADVVPYGSDDYYLKIGKDMHKYWKAMGRDYAKHYRSLGKSYADMYAGVKMAVARTSEDAEEDEAVDPEFYITLGKDMASYWKKQGKKYKSYYKKMDKKMSGTEKSTDSFPFDLTSNKMVSDTDVDSRSTMTTFSLVFICILVGAALGAGVAYFFKKRETLKTYKEISA